MKLKLLIPFLAALACYGQAVRVDPIPAFTVASNVPAGANPPILALPGATVAVCADAGCSAPLTTYTDAGGATICQSATPLVPAGTASCAGTTDSRGNFGFWVTAGTNGWYKITTLSTTYGPYPFSAPGGGGGGGGGSSFSAITGGTNNASLVIGPSGSLTRSGGTIDASSWVGVGISPPTTSNQVALTTSTTAAAWKTIPNCPDGSGHLNYNGTFTCGTSGGGSSTAMVYSFNPNSTSTLTCGSATSYWFEASTTLTGAATIASVTCPPPSGGYVQVSFTFSQGSTVYGVTLPAPFNSGLWSLMPANSSMTCSGQYDGTSWPAVCGSSANVTILPGTVILSGMGGIVQCLGLNTLNQMVGTGTPCGTGGGGGTPGGTNGQLQWNNGGVFGGFTATGDLTFSEPNFTLATVNTSPGVPGTFGDSSHVAQITVNAKGLVTGVTAVSISGGGGGSPGGSNGQLQYNNSGAFGGFTAGGDLTFSNPNFTLATVNSSVGDCGSSSRFAVPTLDGKGRTTACTSYAFPSAPSDMMTTDTAQAVTGTKDFQINQRFDALQQFYYSSSAPSFSWMQGISGTYNFGWWDSSSVLRMYLNNSGMSPLGGSGITLVAPSVWALATSTNTPSMLVQGATSSSTYVLGVQGGSGSTSDLESFFNSSGSKVAYVGYQGNIQGSTIYTTSTAYLSDIMGPIVFSGVSATTSTSTLLQLGNLVGLYNNVATAGMGIPPIYFTEALTGQTGSISTTSITCGGSMCPAGQYRLAVNMLGTGGSGAVTLNIGWHDAYSLNYELCDITVTGSPCQSELPIHTDGSQQISFFTTYTGLTYQLFFVLERLQ